MIQRPDSLASMRVAAACLALLSGCGAQRAASVPRTLSGVAVRGAFVPPSSYEAYIRGELALAQGRADEAVPHFELATTAPEEDAYLLSRLALARLLAGDGAGATRTLEEAERVDPCAEELWLTRGRAAEQAHDVAAARRAYARATVCAPRSPRGELALSSLVAALGEEAAALELLVRAAERPLGAPTLRTLESALRASDPAAFAHATSSLGLHRAPHAPSLARVLELALSRGLPRVALRAREAHLAPLSAALEAEILYRSGELEKLAALLARRNAEELGGPEKTTRLALAVGDFDRAELEASSALARGESDALRVLRARAALRLGRLDAALGDAREVRDPSLRGALLAELLAWTGSPALARELEQQQGAAR